MQLLRTTNANITDIAEQCISPRQIHSIKAFRRRYRLSLLQFWGETNNPVSAQKNRRCLDGMDIVRFFTGGFRNGCHGNSAGASNARSVQTAHHGVWLRCREQGCCSLGTRLQGTTRTVLRPAAVKSGVWHWALLSGAQSVCGQRHQTVVRCRGGSKRKRLTVQWEKRSPLNLDKLSDSRCVRCSKQQCFQHTRSATGRAVSEKCSKQNRQRPRIRCRGRKHPWATRHRRRRSVAVT